MQKKILEFGITYSMKPKLPYLNVGCGIKYRSDWFNVDLDSNNDDVISANLLHGMPFPDDSFDVLYHSNVLEHFEKDAAFRFMKECHRVLRADGIIRVVVPDLENIVDEYKKYLLENVTNPTKESEANYDWLLLEMYDQTVRHRTGGMMLEYLRQRDLINEQYVIDRVGHAVRSIRAGYLSGIKNTQRRGSVRLLGFSGFSKRLLRGIRRRVANLLLGEKYRVGSFRLSGEIHMWMYDRFSLSRLLREVGFRDVKVLNAYHSDIPDWGQYELDVRNGLAFDPTSLFVEARK